MFRWIENAIGRFTGGLTQRGNAGSGVYGGMWPAIPTDSGEVVDPLQAMTLSAYFSAIRVLSEDVASLPIRVTVREGMRFESLDNDPVAELLGRVPNPEMTAFTWERLCMIWMLAWGNAYTYIDRGPGGVPRQLVPIEPWRVTVDRDATHRLVYRVEESTNSQFKGPAELRADDLLHFLGFTLNGITGISVAEYAAESLGVGLAQQVHEASFYKNGARPGVMLVHPGRLSDQARANLKESFERNTSGRNQGSVQVLQEGMAVEQLRYTHVDAQFFESKKFMIGEVARWFRLPAYKLGDANNAPGSNVEEQGNDYLVGSLQQHLHNIEQEIDRKLFPNRPNTHAEHETRGMMRASAEARASYIARGIQNGFLTPNEARGMEGLNPLDQEWANSLMAQRQLAPLGFEATSLAAAPAANAEPDAAPDPDPSTPTGDPEP